MTAVKPPRAVPSMRRNPTSLRRTPSRVSQRGVSLFVIIIVVLLSMLLALWALRAALLNELVVGNDADYQRAFAAAEAMLQDAELDIRHQQGDSAACGNAVAAGDLCRVSTPVRFPTEAREFTRLIGLLDGQATKCLRGICQKRTGIQDFWDDAATLDSMIADGVGARYGEFTGASTGDESALTSNPILNDRRAGKGAWYWVEVMPYSPSADTGRLIVDGDAKPIPLDLIPSVIYRITAIARGQKPSTQAVLQQIYVRQKRLD